MSPTVARIPYECMVLVEPGIVDRESFAANPRDRKKLDSLVKMILSRRNEWDSHDAAFTYFSKRMPYKTWDPRIVRLVVVRILNRSSLYRLECLTIAFVGQRSPARCRQYKTHDEMRQGS